MSFLIVAGLLLQIICVVAVLKKWRGAAIGKVGFVFLASTFMYHGASEVVEALFPGRNPYRNMVGADALGFFVLLQSFTMLMYTVTYLLRSKSSRRVLRTENVIGMLRDSYFLRWPVLLALALPSYGLVILREQATYTSGYWASGIAFQFTPYLFGICLATANIRSKARYAPAFFLAFGLLLAVSDSRLLIVSTFLVAWSAMARAGIRVTWRTTIAVVACLAFAVAALELTRAVYGRFSEGQSYTARISAISESAADAENASVDAVLQDSTYRLDGNSFGALILERQLNGWGIMGLDLPIVVARYMIPSFIFSEKLRLDESLRNEEGYETAFYDFPAMDYISGLWASLTALTGFWVLPFWGVALGWAIAMLDKWLAREASTTAYLVGLAAVSWALNVELGLAAALFIARGFSVFLILAWILRRTLRGRRSAVADKQAGSLPLRPMIGREAVD